MQYLPQHVFAPMKVPFAQSPTVNRTAIAEVKMSYKFKSNVRYKFVYRISIGERFVDQVSTVATFKDNSYFQSLLGQPTIPAAPNAMNLTCSAASDAKSICDDYFREKFDFIEIGTSAFNTCAQAASPHHKGISVEPLSFYLDMLPNRPGLIKENAAVDTKLVDPDLDFGMMYYFDHADLVAHGFRLDGYHYYLFGISSFGSIQSAVLEMHRQQQYFKYSPSIFMQRNRVVPRLTVEELYLKHAVKETGVFKLDCEGMDISILEQYIGMLKKYGLDFPCYIVLEILMTKLAEFPAVVEMLQGVGYDVISMSPPGWSFSAGDLYGVHSKCPSDQRNNLRSLLSTQLLGAEDICGSVEESRNKESKRIYCCITMHENADNKLNHFLEKCDETQPFYSEGISPN